MLRLYMSTAQIAEETGTNPQTVRRFIREMKELAANGQRYRKGRVFSGTGKTTFVRYSAYMDYLNVRELIELHAPVPEYDQQGIERDLGLVVQPVVNVDIDYDRLADAILGKIANNYKEPREIVGRRKRGSALEGIS